MNQQSNSRNQTVRGFFSSKQLEAFSRAIPGILASSSLIKEDPRLYYSRLDCFCHSYRFGKCYTLCIGHLMELWEKGVYRDGDCFFFGMAGDSGWSHAYGVDTSNGSFRVVDIKPQGLLTAGMHLKCLFDAQKDFPQEPNPPSFDEFIEFAGNSNPRESTVVYPSFPIATSHGFPVMRYMEFINMRDGHFLMGRNSNRHGILPSPFPGIPTHVRMFQMMPVPVTREMWHSVTGCFPSGDSNPSAPVTNVSWNQCMSFAGLLSQLDDEYDYSLPTEVQWEYACRGGTETDYPWGDDPDDPMGDEYRPTRRCFNEVCPVGLGKPNRLGIHDMWSGASEWCLERFDPIYPSGLVPQWIHTGPGLRAIRGGETFIPIPSCLSEGHAPWYSDGHYGNFRRYGLGFRLVRTRKELCPSFERRGARLEEDRVRKTAGR